MSNPNANAFKKGLDNHANQGQDHRAKPEATQKDLDHHANQLNKNSEAHKKTQDHRANQLNPNSGVV